MTDQELARLLRRMIIAAQHAHRTNTGVLGALTTPAVPAALIDRLCDGLAPVLRELVDTAVEARLNPAGFSSDEIRIEAYARGDGHRQVRATHLKTGVSATGEGEWARRDALLALRVAVDDRLGGAA